MRSKESGFTLVEFLTATAATMVVMAATFQLLAMTFTANTGMNEVMATQQNIRVAINTIARDIVMAGTGLPTGGISIPNGPSAEAITRPGIGGDMLTPNDTIAMLAPGDTVGAAINLTATDALTITAMNQESPTWTLLCLNPLPPAADDDDEAKCAELTGDGTEIVFNEDVQDGEFVLEAGDVLVFSNTNGKVMGVVTSVSDEDDDFRAFFEDCELGPDCADALNLNQPLAEAGNIRAILSDDGTLPPTTVTRANIVTYYLNNDMPAHPKLMRALNGSAPQVIVEDVENLQFSFDLYDFDAEVTTSGVADTDLPNQIRSVHVVINGRSSKVLQRTHDWYRFSLASKVNVRNATFRDRYTEL